MVSPMLRSLEGSPTMHQSMRSPRAAQRLDHALGAVDRRAFLVAGDQEGERARCSRVRGDEFLAGGDHGGEPALHIGGAAAVEQAVADRRLERIGAPFLQRAGRDHVGVPGEAQHRAAARRAAPRNSRRCHSAAARPRSRRRSSRCASSSWQPSSAGVTEARAMSSWVSCSGDVGQVGAL